MSFAKNISKNIGKNISKNFSGKCIQRRLDHPKQSITDALGTISKRVFLKTAELTWDLISNKIADSVAKSYDGKITKASRTSRQNILRQLKMNKIKKYLKKHIYISGTKARNYRWTNTIV